MNQHYQPLRPSSLGNGARTARQPSSSSPTPKLPGAASSSSCPLRSSSSPSYRSTGAATGGRRPYRPSASSAEDRARWHDRFLDRCAERLRTERAAAIASRRVGLASYDDADREGQDWSAEEEAILRRRVLGEARRFRWAMERAGEEVDITDADAVMAAWDGLDDDSEEPPPGTEDEDLVAYADQMLATTHVDLGPESSPQRPILTSLLVSLCPACSTAGQMATHVQGSDGLGVHCAACGWHVAPTALAAADHAFAAHVPATSAHQPQTTYAPAVGSLTLCSGCEEAFVLG